MIHTTVGPDSNLSVYFGGVRSRKGLLHLLHVVGVTWTLTLFCSRLVTGNASRFPTAIASVTASSGMRSWIFLYYSVHVSVTQVIGCVVYHVFAYHDYVTHASAVMVIECLYCLT